MLRRLFTLASALSLLVYVSAVILAILSGSHPIMLGPGPDPRGTPGWGYGGSIMGGIGGMVLFGVFRQEAHRPFHRGEVRKLDWHPFQKLGVVIGEPLTCSDEGQDARMRYATMSRVYAPTWLVCVLAAAMPLAWGYSAVRRGYTRREGVCRSCGYDLRASKGRCPECGEPIKSTSV